LFSEIAIVDINSGSQSHRIELSKDSQVHHFGKVKWHQHDSNILAAALPESKIG